MGPTLTGFFPPVRGGAQRRIRAAFYLPLLRHLLFYETFLGPAAPSPRREELLNSLVPNLPRRKKSREMDNHHHHPTTYYQETDTYHRLLASESCWRHPPAAAAPPPLRCPMLHTPGEKMGEGRNAATLGCRPPPPTLLIGTTKKRTGYQALPEAHKPAPRPPPPPGCNEEIKIKKS